LAWFVAVEDTLRHFVGPYQTDWDEYLNVAEFAMNNAWNQSIRNTPFMLNYGLNILRAGM
jgi:hypothetical protein